MLKPRGMSVYIVIHIYTCGTLYIYIYIYIYISPANEFECGTLGFNFLWLCSSRISDSVTLFRRLIIVKVAFISGYYCEDFFDRDVIIFNFRIRVCECPVGVNYLWSLLASADIFCMCWQGSTVKRSGSFLFYIETSAMGS